MKKLFVSAFVCCVLLSMMACSVQVLDTKALVKFVNKTSDVQVARGIGLGEARYNGTFHPGDSTPYYETAPGTYSVDLLTTSGSWWSDPTTAFTVDVKHAYTVSLTGDWNGGWAYAMTADR